MLEYFLSFAIWQNARIFIGFLPLYEMADKTVSIPSGSGGLLRYYDESKSKFRIKPSYVILFIIFTVIFEILLRII